MRAGNEFRYRADYLPYKNFVESQVQQRECNTWSCFSYQSNDTGCFRRNDKQPVDPSHCKGILVPTTFTPTSNFYAPQTDATETTRPKEENSTLSEGSIIYL